MNKAIEQIVQLLGTKNTPISSAEIKSALSLSVSNRTIQRYLAQLIDEGLVESIGERNARRYIASSKQSSSSLGTDYREFISLSSESLEIVRYINGPIATRTPVGYESSFLEDYIPGKTFYLDEPTLKKLHKLGQTGGSPQPVGTYGREILDRLLIDLSWASSHLEGNTYSRLDTEKLIVYGEHAQGKDALEAQMILNHKRAIEFIVAGISEPAIDRLTLMNLHGLLSDNLMPDPATSGRLRTRGVEISKSVYTPPGVPSQIAEHFEKIIEKVNSIDDPFEQSFFLMVHLPYLQAFEDVNKRTSRLAANIPLLRKNLCPLTFLDVPTAAYLDGILGVYEMTRINLLRDVFVWAYDRSTYHYLRVRKTLAEPDPIRLRFRKELYELVGNIVRSLAEDPSLIISEYARDNIPKDLQGSFIKIAEDELARLHEGIIARYYILPSEFKAYINLQNK